MKAFYHLAIPLLLAVVANSYGQDQPRENLSARGTFRGGFPGGFAFATDDNDQWKVKLPNKASQITFSGPAEPSFLRPGMKVTFSALMNKKGLVKEKVTALTVFTPQEAKDIGVWPEALEGGTNPLEGLFSPREVKEEPKGRGKKPVIEDQVCRVGGTLKSFKGDRLVVVAGRMEVKFQLAENAKIRVSVSDLSWVQLGDKVEVEGWYYTNARQAGLLYANSVSVTAANPLSGEKKKGKADDEDAKEEAAEDKQEAKQDK